MSTEEPAVEIESETESETETPAAPATESRRNALLRAENARLHSMLHSTASQREQQLQSELRMAQSAAHAMHANLGRALHLGERMQGHAEFAYTVLRRYGCRMNIEDFVNVGRQHAQVVGALATHGAEIRQMKAMRPRRMQFD